MNKFLKSTLKYGLAVFMLASILIWCGSPALAGGKKVVWTYNSFHGRGVDIIDQGENWAIEEINKACAGELEIVYYGKQALGFAGPKLPRTVGKGLLPISTMYAPHTGGKYPWIGVLDLPFVYDTMDTGVFYYLAKHLFDDFAKPLLKDNMVLLVMTPQPGGLGLTLSRPINKDDPKAILKGMKVRTSGPGTAWMVKTLGGTPVTMDYAEFYEAAQRGIVEGIDVPFVEIVTKAKVHEVCKYMSMTDVKSYKQYFFGNATWMVVVNKDKLESLSPRCQEIVRHRFRSAQRWIDYSTNLIPAVNKTLQEKYNMKMNHISLETMAYLKEKAPEYWDIWRKKAGPYGNQLLDKVIKLVKEYESKYK